MQAFNLNIFVVYKNGKSRLISENNLTQIYSFLQKSKTSIIHDEVFSSVKTHYHPSDEYKRRLINAYQQEIPIKNCFLCRYHGENRSYYKDENPIACQLLKIKCNSNQAAECNFYQSDPKCFPKIPEIPYFY